VTQRGIGRLVCRVSKQRTDKGVRRYRKNWIYLPTGLVGDENFPFETGNRILISIVDGKRLMLKRA
jgi:hypothetical protein